MSEPAVFIADRTANRYATRMCVHNVLGAAAAMVIPKYKQGALQGYCIHYTDGACGWHVLKDNEVALIEAADQTIH